MGNKIIELRNWFRTHGKMDFELNKKLPKEEHGKHITYKCKAIEAAFKRALEESSNENAALPLHDVTHWVAVKDKLPENGYYLCTNGVNLPYIASYIDGEWTCDLEYVHPKYWAVLQQPPCG